jgi:hypothetical protein
MAVTEIPVVTGDTTIGIKRLRRIKGNGLVNHTSGIGESCGRPLIGTVIGEN